MPASRSISRSSSTNGQRSSAASASPSVDLPAPRRPTSATALAAQRLVVAEVAHQPEHDVLEAMLGQPLKEAPDEPVLDRAFAVVEQFGERHAERARDAAQQEDRRIALAGFELREVALGDARLLRQDLAGDAAALAGFAHLAAHFGEEVRVGAAFGRAFRWCSFLAQPWRTWVARESKGVNPMQAIYCMILGPVKHFRSQGARADSVEIAAPSTRFRGLTRATARRATCSIVLDRRINMT